MIEFLEHHLFTCSTKQLFGMECPGCGMQRAAIALLKGDFAASFAFNASLLPFLFTICFVIAHLAFRFKKGPGIIIAMFTITSSIMLGQFVVKLFLNH